MIDYHHYLSILLIGYSKNFLLKLVNLSEFAISSEHIKLLEVYRLLSKFLRNNNENLMNLAFSFYFKYNCNLNFENQAIFHLFTKKFY